MMTDKLEILRAYQSWRRGEDERTMHEAGLSPQVIGAAIDWAIAELEKPRPAVPDGWKNIETAPKDGSPIYVRRPATFVEDFCHVVTWDAEDEWWQVHDGKFFHSLRGDAPREWRDIEPAEGGES